MLWVGISAAILPQMSSVAVLQTRPLSSPPDISAVVSTVFGKANLTVCEGFGNSERFPKEK